MEWKKIWYFENLRPKKHLELSTDTIVRIAEARRLGENTEESFDVVHFNANGHLDLRATYDAAPSTAAEPRFRQSSSGEGHPPGWSDRTLPRVRLYERN